MMHDVYRLYTAMNRDEECHEGEGRRWPGFRLLCHIH